MNEFLLNLLKHSALMSAAILLLIALSRVLHNRTSPQLRFACWTVVALGLLIFARPNLYTMSIPGSLPSAANSLTEQIEIITVPRQPIYPEKIIIPRPSAQPTQKAEANELPKAKPNPIQTAEAELVKTTLSFDKILKTAPFVIWCAGAFVFIFICAVRHIRFMRTIKRWGRPVSDEHLTAFLADVCREVNLKRNIRLIVCPVVTTPVITGFFRPAIILPDDAIESSKLRFMLIHECIHFKRGDIWAKSLALLAMAVHWFNPLVYLMNRAMIDEAEHSCDLAVLRCTGMDKRYQYGETILYTAKRGKQAISVLSSAFGGGKSLKRRLLDIVERTAPKRWVSVSCAAVLLTGIALTGGLVGCEVKGEIVDVPADFTPTEELVIYVPPNEANWMKPLINLYKKTYPNVNVTVEEFGTDVEAYNQRISTELMVGKGPDVIFPNTLSNMDIRKAADSGVFLDINQFIEQDEEFNRAEYVKAVMDGGIYKGRQYIVPINYGIKATIGYAPKLNEYGFNLENTANATSLLEEGVSILTEPESSLKAIFTQANYGKYSLFFSSGIRLADYEKNLTLPDEDEFRAFCESYKPYFKFDVPPEKENSKDYFDDSSPWWEDLQAGTYMLADMWDNKNMGNLFWCASLLKTAGGYEIYPIWRADGGFQAVPVDTIAIRGTSTNQQNSYNFVKLMLSKEVQSMRISGWPVVDANPVRKESIEEIAETGKTFGDQSKEYAWPQGPLDANLFSYLDDAEIKTIYDMVLSVTHCDLYGVEAINWFEYMLPYFKDESSLDDCVAKLKNKLKVYISE